MSFKLKTTAALVALATSSMAFAANTGGFATTAGGEVSGAKKVTVNSMQGIIDAVAAARIDAAGKKVTAGAYPLHIIYTGNEDALINQIVKDHTVDASGNCPKPHWNDTYREVSLKEFTKGITIEGANGSSANFGITIVNGGNVVIKNMKMGALGGANNDADLIRIDNSPNVWIDHNELFAVNNECNGSPDKDLTFESAIDIKKNGTNVTVSYNYIHDSKKVGLMGHTQSGGTTDYQRNVTFHHNIYTNVNGRLPLQRGGVMHAYNNLYSKITGSGINVRAGGKAIVERNYFENSKNPLTCRFDTNGCGSWYLDSNNTTSAASNATYGISWDSAGTGGINADSWTSTLSSKPSLPYSYEPVSAACVKAKLASYAGVGKSGATLTASACSGTSSSSSVASSSAASSSKASSSAASSSVASSSSSSAAASSVKLSAAVSGSSINLSWTAPSGTLGTMQVYRDTDADPSGRVRIAALASTARSYTDSTAAAGTTYYYWIKTTVNGTTVNSDAASAKISSSSSSSSVASSSSSSSVASSSSSSASGAPTLSGTGDYPSGWSKCADLGGTCTAKSTGWVAFGRKGKWVTKYVGSGKNIACTVAAFGSDPLGNPNKCSTK